MAPEQILSDAVDPRADIYSFGIVLFRWLTGELPFESGPMLRLFSHHLESKAPPPSWLLEEIHPGLEKIILACMRKNPDNRYATMFEVITDLECVIGGQQEVSGAQLQCDPDEYWPRTEQGKQAYEILCRLGASKRPTPVPEEKSIPMQSGVSATGTGSSTVGDLVEKAAG